MYARCSMLLTLLFCVTLFCVTLFCVTPSVAQDWALDHAPPSRRYESGLGPSPLLLEPLERPVLQRPILGLPGRTGDRLGLRGVPLFDRAFYNLRSLFRYGDPDQQGRHIGRGEPIQGGSWLNRRWHVGWFFGGLFPDPLIDGQVDQQEDVFGGYRVGYDFDHYWGGEARFGFAHLATEFATDNFPRSSRDWFWDVQLMYYPWGDAHWRPYASLGFGTANFRFTDHRLVQQNEILVHFPVGVGVKYYFKKWLALRADAMDNLAISGSGLDTMHNFSITGGVEVHFGDRRVAYGL